MSDKCEVRKGECEGISLLLLKSTKGAARFNIPITVNSTYAFTSYTLWRDLGFNPGIFGTEASDLGSASPAFLIPALVRRRNKKFVLCCGLNLGPLCGAMTLPQPDYWSPFMGCYNNNNSLAL